MLDLKKCSIKQQHSAQLLLHFLDFQTKDSWWRRAWIYKNLLDTPTEKTFLLSSANDILPYYLRMLLESNQYILFLNKPPVFRKLTCLRILSSFSMLQIFGSHFPPSHSVSSWTIPHSDLVWQHHNTKFIINLAFCCNPERQSSFGHKYSLKWFHGLP